MELPLIVAPAAHCRITCSFFLLFDATSSRVTALSDMNLSPSSDMASLLCVVAPISTSLNACGADSSHLYTFHCNLVVLPFHLVHSLSYFLSSSKTLSLLMLQLL